MKLCSIYMIINSDNKDRHQCLSNCLFERLVYFPYAYAAVISTMQPVFFVNLKVDVLPMEQLLLSSRMRMTMLYFLSTGFT